MSLKLSHIRNVLRSWVVQAYIGLSALFLVVSKFVVSGTLIEVGDAYATPMSACASYVYMRRCMRSIADKKGIIDYLDILMLGIGGAWACNAVLHPMRLYGRLFQGVTLPNSYLFAYLVFCLSFAASCHILVQGAEVHRKLTFEGFKMVGGSLLVGTILVSVVIALNLYNS